MGTHFTAEPTESRSIFQVNRRMRNRTLAVWEDGGREAPSYPMRTAEGGERKEE